MGRRTQSEKLPARWAPNHAAETPEFDAGGFTRAFVRVNAGGSTFNNDTRTYMSLQASPTARGNTADWYDIYHADRHGSGFRSLDTKINVIDSDFSSASPAIAVGDRIVLEVPFSLHYDTSTVPSIAANAQTVMEQNAGSACVPSRVRLKNLGPTSPNGQPSYLSVFFEGHQRRR